MVGWWTLSYVLSRSGIIPIRPGKRAHESCTTVRFIQMVVAIISPYFVVGKVMGDSYFSCRAVT